MVFSSSKISVLNALNMDKSISEYSFQEMRSII